MDNVNFETCIPNGGVHLEYHTSRRHGNGSYSSPWTWTTIALPGYVSSGRHLGSVVTNIYRCIGWLVEVSPRWTASYRGHEGWGGGAECRRCWAAGDGHDSRQPRYLSCHYYWDTPIYLVDLSWPDQSPRDFRAIDNTWPYDTYLR